MKHPAWRIPPFEVSEEPEFAGIAQLVERLVPNEKVARSNRVTRSNYTLPVHFPITDSARLSEKQKVRTRFIPYYALLAACLLPRASAVAGMVSSCPSNFEELYRETRPGTFLTEEDKQAIRSIREDASLSSAEKARRIFRAVLDARLRSADPDIRSAVEKAHASAKVKSVSKRPGAYYNSYNHKVTIKIPEALLGGAVEYMLKIHELQHAYQHAALDLARKSFWAKGTKGTLLSEADAISLEWHYLRQIPKEIRREAATRIEATASFRGLPKRFLLSALEDADLPFASYLKHQRELGRYSKNMVRMLTATTYGTPGMALSTLLYLLYSEFRPSEEGRSRE